MYDRNIKLNREVYSNKEDITKFENKYLTDVTNNSLPNFELSTNKRCIDTTNEKLLKCPENNCCTQYGDCTQDYNYCNKNNRFQFSNFGYEKDDNLLNGNKFNEEYYKWVYKKINKDNKFKYSDDFCGITSDNIAYKCIDNKCCINSQCKYGESCRFISSNEYDGDIVEDSKSSGLSPGVIAGIVIGCIVGTILIFFLIKYFIKSKSKIRSR